MCANFRIISEKEFVLLNTKLGYLKSAVRSTISDKIKWDTLPYVREKAVSSPFNIHLDFQH